MYDVTNVGDQRHPSGRRPPGLPLPAPAHDDAAPTREHAKPRPPTRLEATSEIPRLPEVSVHDDSRVDHRVAPPRPAAGRAPAQVARPVVPDRGLHTPVPPPRSSNVRAHTAQFSTLIGGRYQIVQRIGQGGMGKVYKVTHAHLSRTFALKIISSTVAETDEARALFYREARFASAMSHPSITQVVDFGEDEKVGMFMVMEFVDGEPLNRLLFREKRLSPRKACEIVMQVAEALHYIHKQNVVHCDIKTENILISEQEHEGQRSKMVAKLLDFGLARSLTATRLSTSLSGTPHYVAPERIRGEPASPASDVYGVGILLYELVCGQVPWDGPVQKILAGHLDEIPRAPSSLVENLDSALETLILRALAKRPAERHKDMAAFIYELRTVMEMNGMSRRARGPAKRVVIEQKSEHPRDELARIAFDASRIPMAMVSADGVIETANPAFATFVMGLAVEVEGLPVRSTALVNAWATAESDIERTLNGTPIRRVIEVDVAEGQVRRLLLWVDPVSRDQVLLGVHPLDG